MRGNVMMKSKIGESVGLVNNGATKSQPICPKPRRPVNTVSEVLKPLKCTKNWHSRQLSNKDERDGILSMLNEKMVNDVHESSSCYSGSPPGRTENPLIHDIRFIHQMELLSPMYKGL